MTTSHASLLQIVILTVLSFIQSTHSQTQCLVAVVEIDAIASGLNASRWEGEYIYEGTQSSCPQYETANGMTLRYTPNSWILTAVDGGELAFETTDIGPPCNPPNGTTEWTHYTDINTTSVTISCISTYSPSTMPSSSPSTDPTTAPSVDPTVEPTMTPSMDPTLEPTTSEPTMNPSSDPTQIPTAFPSLDPTSEPTMNPSLNPTMIPTANPVTAAPTIECGRIEVELPLIGAVASRVEGVYYQHALTTSNGYPYWTQHDPSNFVQIKFEDGAWTVIDSVDGIRLKDTSNSTAYIPPYQSTAVWIDTLDDNAVSYIVNISCGAITLSPTVLPTAIPTVDPTLYPSTEPTEEPTIAEPTEMPSNSPTIVTSAAPKEEEESTIDSIIDYFSLLEWLIIAGTVLICCCSCCLLILWRKRQIDKTIKEEEEYHNRVQIAQQERNKELEMGMAGPRRIVGPTTKVSFDYEAATESPESPRSRTAGRPLSTKGNQSVPSTARDDDFAAALAVVGSSKSKPSLYSKAASADESESREHEMFGGYDARNVYSHTFGSKPFGMEWKTRKSDKKNLYVSKVSPNSQADEGGVQKGSKLLSFNGEMIENMGGNVIYSKLSEAKLPLTITFLKPDAGRSSVVAGQVSAPNVLNAVKSDSEDNGTPEPPRAPSNAPPGDSPKAMDNDSVPAPKPPSADQEVSHENLVPVTPGGPDEDFPAEEEEEEEEEEVNEAAEEEDGDEAEQNGGDSPVNPMPQALLDAFDDDANVQPEESADHQKHVD